MEFTYSKQPPRPSQKNSILNLLKFNRNYFYTPLIIYLNIAVFLFMAVSGVNPISPSAESLITWGGNMRSITLDGQYWRLLTNIFLHGGLLHLLFNMYALLNIGAIVELIFGKHRFFLVYISSGIIASLLSIIFHANAVSVGASGAIFGIYGLFLSLLVFKALNIPAEIRKSLISSIMFFIVFNLAFGFSIKVIDNAAHIGGLVCGFLLGSVYIPALRKPPLSKLVSIGIPIFLLFSIIVARISIPSDTARLKQILTKLEKSEKQTAWVHQKNFSTISKDSTQFYFNKLQHEGVDLYTHCLSQLQSLVKGKTVTENMGLLLRYCSLKATSFKLMQKILQYNRETDRSVLDQTSAIADSLSLRLWIHPEADSTR